MVKKKLLDKILKLVFQTELNLKTSKYILLVDFIAHLSVCLSLLKNNMYECAWLPVCVLLDVLPGIVH